MAIFFYCLAGGKSAECLQVPQSFGWFTSMGAVQSRHQRGCGVLSRENSRDVGGGIRGVVPPTVPSRHQTTDGSTSDQCQGR